MDLFFILVTVICHNRCLHTMTYRVRSNKQQLLGLEFLDLKLLLADLILVDVVFATNYIIRATI